MPFRLLESSSDVILEADGPDAGGALVALAQAFAHVTTGGQEPPESDAHAQVEVRTRGDAAKLAVAFVNDLIYRFTTDAFLPTGGTVEVRQDGEEFVVSGRLDGYTFDPDRHKFGTEVKAATLHEAAFAVRDDVWVARVLVDL